MHSEKPDFASELRSRADERTAERIIEALKDAGLLSQLQFLSDGKSASAFEIKESGLILKIIEKRQQVHSHNTSSRFMPEYVYRGNFDGDIAIAIMPKLTEQGVTPLHQEMLRYQLWTREGREFWDIFPAESRPREIKNTMLDHRGVPYQIDEDAVKPFDDRYQEYPADGNGRRSDAQYLDYRANCWTQEGRPDILSPARFSEIKAACDQCEWKIRQSDLFEGHINRDVLQSWVEALESAKPEHALITAR